MKLRENSRQRRASLRHCSLQSGQTSITAEKQLKISSNIGLSNSVTNCPLTIFGNGTNEIGGNLTNDVRDGSTTDRDGRRSWARSNQVTACLRQAVS